MKKLIGAFYFTLAVGSISAQNTMKNVKVVGSFYYGGQEITSILELPNGCIRKTNPHTIGLFTTDETFQIAIDETQLMAEVLKPNLNERVFVNKNCNDDGFNYSDLQTDSRMLIFKTVEDYEHILTTRENATQEEEEMKNEEFLQSISKLNYPRFENSTIYNQLVSLGTIDNYPTLILKMLNADGAIQIGNFIFRLDFLEEKAYTLPVLYKNTEYNKLVAGQNGNSHVTKYPWGKEVVYDAHDDLPKWGCSENAAETDVDSKTFTNYIEWDLLLDGNINNQEISATLSHKKFDGDLKARYRWTPIGWDLYSKVVIKEKEQSLTGTSGGQITWTSSWATADVHLVLVWQRRYKPKCQGDTGYSSTMYNYGTGVATGQSYSGLRALTKYYMGANAYVEIDGQWELMDFGLPSNPNTYTGNSFQVMIKRGY